MLILFFLLNDYNNCAKILYETLVILDSDNVDKFKVTLYEASINAEKIAEICKNADKQYEDVKGVLENTLISNQANVFTKESERYNKSAKIWLVLQVLLLYLTFYYCCILHVIESIVLIIHSILIISLLVNLRYVLF